MAGSSECSALRELLGGLVRGGGGLGGGGRNSGGDSGRVTSGGGSASPGGAGRNLLMNRADLLGGATSALPYAPGIALGL